MSSFSLFSEVSYGIVVKKYVGTIQGGGHLKLGKIVAITAESNPDSSETAFYKGYILDDNTVALNECFFPQDNIYIFTRPKSISGFSNKRKVSNQSSSDFLKRAGKFLRDHLVGTSVAEDESLKFSTSLPNTLSSKSGGTGISAMVQEHNEKVKYSMSRSNSGANLNIATPQSTPITSNAVLNGIRETKDKALEVLGLSKTDLQTRKTVIDATNILQGTRKDLQNVLMKWSIKVFRVMNEWSDAIAALIMEDVDTIFDRIVDIESKLISNLLALRNAVKENSLSVEKNYIDKLLKNLENGLEDGALLLGEEVVPSRGAAKQSHDNILKLYQTFWQADKRIAETRKELIDKAARRNKFNVSAAPGTPSRNAVNLIPAGANPTSPSGGATGSLIDVKSAGFVSIPNGNMQLMLELSKFDLDTIPGGTAELYLSLFTINDKKEFVPVSEEFCIKNPASQSSNFLKTIVTDLCNRDVNMNLWLLCKLCRRGELHLEKKYKTEAGAEFKRVLACGVCNFNSSVVNSLVNGITIDLRMPLCTSTKEEILAELPLLIVEVEVESSSSSNTQNNLMNNLGNNATATGSNANLFSLLSKKDIKEFDMLKEVVVSASLFFGNLKKVFEKEPWLMGPKITKLLSFPMDLNPAEQRHDFYFTLKSIQKMKDKDKSILVQAKVIYNQEVLPCIRTDCLSEQQLNDTASSSSSSTADTSLANSKEYKVAFESAVYYHVLNPTFNETFCVSLKNENIGQLLPNAILVFLLSTASSKRKENPKVFALAYFELKHICNSTQRDFGISIYKYKKDVYPYSKSSERHIKQFASNVQLRSSCSTNFVLQVGVKVVSREIARDARDSYIDQLVRKQYSDDIMRGLSFTDDHSFAIYLQQILGALFQVLDEKSNYSEVTGKIMETLTTKFSQLMLTNSKYITKIVKDYATSDKFTSTEAWKIILNRLLSVNVNGTEMMEVSKALSLLFEFLVASWKNSRKVGAMAPSKSKSNTVNTQTTANGLDIVEQEFILQILKFMNKLNELMSLKEPKSIIGIQTTFLKYGTSFFEQLGAIFENDKKTLGRVIKDFLHSIPFDHTKNNIIQGKLAIINSIVQGKIFEYQVTRQIIMPVIMETLSTHFQIRIEFGSSLGVLLQLLRFISSLKDTQEKFEMLTQIYPFISAISLEMQNLQLEEEKLLEEIRFYDSQLSDEKLSNQKQKNEQLKLVKEKEVQDLKRLTADIICAAMLYLHVFDEECILLQCKSASIVNESEESFTFTTTPSNVCFDLLECIKIIIHYAQRSIPSNWILFKRQLYHTVCNSFQRFFNALTLQQEMISKSDWRQLWSDSFKIMFHFMSCQDVQLELLPSYKRERLAGEEDFRFICLDLFCQHWSQRDTLQYYQTDMLHSFLSVLPIDNFKFQQKMIEIIANAMEIDFVQHSTMKKSEVIIQRQLLEKNVIAVFVKHIDYLQALLCKVEKIREESLETISNIMQMILMVNRIDNISNEKEEEKTMACLHVIDNFKQNQNMDLYFTYLMRLSEMHNELGNKVEAANCLGEYANTLDWNRQIQMPYLSSNYGEQNMAERKEAILREMMSIFESGKEFEYAIETSKTLRFYFESTLRYEKLDELLQNEAKWYRAILNENRNSKESFYFVNYKRGFVEDGYIGAYVYKFANEKLGDVLQKFTKKYPKTTFERASIPAETETELEAYYQSKGIAVPDQIIEFFTVFPSTETMLRKEIPKYLDCSPKVKNFIRSNNVSLFLQKGGQSDATSQTVEYTYFFIEGKCPHITRKFKVNRVERVQMNLVEIAIQDIYTKSFEIRDCIYALHLSKTKDVKLLSQQIMGTVSADVNGGAKKYFASFFNEEYLLKYPEHKGLLIDFYKALLDQHQTIRDALEMWRKWETGSTFKLLQECMKRTKYEENLMIKVPSSIRAALNE